MTKLATIFKFASIGIAGSAVIGGIAYVSYSKLSFKKSLVNEAKNDSNLSENTTENNKSILDDSKNTSDSSDLSDVSVDVNVSKNSVDQLKDATLISNKSIFVIAESTGKQELDSSINFSNDADSKNYKCKLDDVNLKDSFDCTIKYLNPQKFEKKYIQLESLKTDIGEYSGLSEMKVANNLFKIEVSSSFYDHFKTLKIFSKKIKLVLNNSSDKYFGSFKPLFGINNNVITASTIYSLAKVSENINDAKNLMCDIVKSSIGCQVYDFSTDNDHSFPTISFKGSLDNVSSINSEKYYLFKFTNNSKKDIVNFKSDKASVTVENKKISLNNVVPSIVAGPDVNNKLVFLLKTTTTN